MKFGAVFESLGFLFATNQRTNFQKTLKEKQIYFIGYIFHNDSLPLAPVPSLFPSFRYNFFFKNPHIIWSHHVYIFRLNSLTWTWWKWLLSSSKMLSGPKAKIKSGGRILFVCLFVFFWEAFIHVQNPICLKHFNSNVWTDMNQWGQSDQTALFGKDVSYGGYGMLALFDPMQGHMSQMWSYRYSK